MALERLYSINFENVTIAAVQDIFSLKAGSSAGFELRRMSLSAGGVTAPAEMRLRLKRMPATVTIGSGGTAPTIQEVQSINNISSGLANARANDTTQATTSGTAQILAAWQWNVLQEFLEIPPTEYERWAADLNEALILDLAGAPASTVCSGFVVWKEL